MAHHNSTPASVLSAPRPSRGIAVGHYGLTRWERRHLAYVSVKRRTAAGVTRNRPFVGDVARDLLGATRRVSKSRALGKKG